MLLKAASRTRARARASKGALVEMKAGSEATSRTGLVGRVTASVKVDREDKVALGRSRMGLEASREGLEGSRMDLGGNREDLKDSRVDLEDSRVDSVVSRVDLEDSREGVEDLRVFLRRGR